ncbi:NAC domain-containing protein [Dioscorea alata]|uniref:NAC domain-containing protein n=1 Tax=Dioscorea alata TaxID=55571 RepID=A0ACB7VME7_DIOAL|nr:NAC domain-containing protein [Dioscorea alata]
MEGDCGIIPGFYFRPSDEDLMMVYLLNKVFQKPFPPYMIEEYDVYSTEPWNLPSKTRYSQDGKSYYFTRAKKSSPRSTRLLRQAGDGCWHMNGTNKKIHDRNGVHVGSTTALTYLHGSNKKKTRWVMHEYRVDQSFYRNSDPQATELVLCCIQESGRGEEINNISSSSSSNNNNRSDQIIAPVEPHVDITMSKKRKTQTDDEERCLLLPGYSMEAFDAEEVATAAAAASAMDHRMMASCAPPPLPMHMPTSMPEAYTEEIMGTQPASGVPLQVDRSRTNNIGCYHAEERAASATDDGMMAGFDYNFCTSPSLPMHMPTSMPEAYTEEIMGTQPASGVPLQVDRSGTNNIGCYHADGKAASATDHGMMAGFDSNFCTSQSLPMSMPTTSTTTQANPQPAEASAVNEFYSDDFFLSSIDAMIEFFSSHSGEEWQQLIASDELLNGLKKSTFQNV